MLELTMDDFHTLTSFLKEKYGLNLTHKKAFIEARLCNYILSMGFSDFSQYVRHLFSDPSGTEFINLIDKLTTNHTYFMREVDHFQYLNDVVLPELTSTITDFDLRIWSAGCSSGEEPYTLAMLFKRYFKKIPLIWDTRILATDINTRVLNMAKQGEYPALALQHLPQDWIDEFFTITKDNNYRIKDEIKNEVLFRKYNLLDPVVPFSKKLHIIFCRNVMIYFDQDTKAKLIKRLYDMTEPGGYLFIGHSETIDKDHNPYRYVKPSIYRKDL